jgi:hypothetical protein
MDLYKSMLAPKSKCYVYIVSMTVPTHLMGVYIAIYIGNKCHLCISEKSVYIFILYILLLFFCLIHAWRLLSAAKRTAHACVLH